MYKLQVTEGLGDCLNSINKNRLVARCKKENTQCLFNYAVRPGIEYQRSNKEAFIKLVNCTDIFKHVDEHEFKLSAARQLEFWGSEYTQEELLPIPLNLSYSSLPNELDKSKINIAVHTTGSTTPKKFSQEQLFAVFQEFDKELFAFHVIDHPKNFEDNVKTYGAFSNVVCRKLDFNENYKLVTLCSLLLCPDSFSKYAGRAANIKMVVACSKLHYVKDIREMFKHSFTGIVGRPSVAILGYTEDKKALVDKIEDIPTAEIIQSMRQLLL